MPTDVRYLVVTDEPYAVLRLEGVLDQTTVGALRGLLLTFVADQHPPTVIDVGGLRVEDPTALRTFAEVARETADWPNGVPVVSVPDAFAASWIAAGLPLAHDNAAAGALGVVEHEALSAELEPISGAARRCRELVTEGCARWELAGATGPACIVATELVNNVVAHAHTPATVTVGLGPGGDSVHLAVRDHNTDLPRYDGTVSTTAYGGRGLLLVASIATRWGSTGLPDGKVVWAVVEPD
jgi:hypothetical protein